MKRIFFLTGAVALLKSFLKIPVAHAVGSSQIPFSWVYFKPDSTILDVISSILTWLFLTVGGIAVIFFIYGGVTYLTAGGNEEQAKKGKTILIQAIIGLVIIALAFLLERTFATKIL